MTCGYPSWSGGTRHLHVGKGVVALSDMAGFALSPKEGFAP